MALPSVAFKSFQRSCGSEVLIRGKTSETRCYKTAQTREQKNDLCNPSRINYRPPVYLLQLELKVAKRDIQAEFQPIHPACTKGLG
jgi:hypothetical protein